MYLISFVIAIIVLIITIDYVLICIKNESYTSIDNDNDKNKASNFINYSKIKMNKTPLDNFRIGNIYDFVMKDNANAHKYYIKSLKQLHSSGKSSDFIKQRLQDRLIINDFAERDDNKFDIQRLNELNAELVNLEKIAFKPSKIEDKIVWTSDSQNVHDNNINNELKSGFSNIESNNKGLFLWNINDIKNYINCPDNGGFEKRNIEGAVKMLDYINAYGGNKIMKLDTTEKDFVSHVFTKIYNENDEHKKKTMMENFLLNLKDSYSSGTPVCVTGRATRIMSSFTDMDEAGLGILRSKPVIKNEILTKSAAIRDKVLNNATEELRNKYNNSIDDTETSGVIAEMKNSIEKMINEDYKEIAQSDVKFVEDTKKDIYESL